MLRSLVLYRIFTQTPDGSFEPVRLVHNARAFFRTKLEVLENEPRKLKIRLHGRRSEDPVELLLLAREVKKQDMKDVTEAERRGQAAGMGALAASCRFLWEFEVPHGAPAAAVLSLCAAAASVALGPVLPPDGSTLFGFLGAIERAEKAR